MIVVAVIGILASIAYPSYVKSRENSQKTSCINNLHQIDGAKDRYAIENRKTAGSPVYETDIIPYFMKKWSSCPAGGSYSINPVNENPTCEIPGHSL